MQVVAEVYNRLILHPISEADRKLNFYLLLMEDIWNKLPQYVDKYNHLKYKYSHEYEFNKENNEIYLTIEQRNVIVGQVVISMGIEENKSEGFDKDFKKFFISC